MSRTQPSSGALTSLESALAELLDGVVPVAPISVPLADCGGRIAAEMPMLSAPHPARNTAALDGWALRSLDLVGASAYSPVPLVDAPSWVETGEALPDGCDCVLEAALVEQLGPLAQALTDAIPGEGVRRAGEEMAKGSLLVIPGRPLAPADRLALRATGCDAVMVRSPRLRLIDVAAVDGSSTTTQFIAELARTDGANITVETIARDAQSIAAALDAASADLVVLVGGTGAGRGDATAEALSMRNALIARGIALRPGQTAATGKLENMPVVALPGLPGHALSAYLLLVQPLLDRLSGRLVRSGITLPLSRKISSSIGVAEIALLHREAAAWQVLSVGGLPLDHIRNGDAWLAIAGDSEGHAAAFPVEAFPLRAV
ncbi:molybdopterin-binding protein [Pseudaminobacter arsenicus]|uniref:Molybdopterin molybdenumtransferase n=1 Tax=Borborobacter arsenicus TaxID=1851146 RepID=A0A432V835_9HYPH|nr:molybdopterin-binding protein [Pseudaminobacter arsenicus]RUM98338.1 molybdopterin-binding protein [Pseudaminobacter arsenicus]